MSQITVFYDAACPLCVKEMSSLKRHLDNKVRFINVLNRQIMAAYPFISLQDSRRILHVVDAKGQLRLAVDANVYLWEQTGTKRYLKLLRLPIIRNIAHSCYMYFARNRYRISRVLTGSERCRQCEL